MPTEVQQFQQFLQERPAGIASLDRAVSEFREYQEELDRFRDSLRVAEEQSARGESGPIDIEAKIKKLRERLPQDAE